MKHTLKVPSELEKATSALSLVVWGQEVTSSEGKAILKVLTHVIMALAELCPGETQDVVSHLSSILEQLMK